MSSPAKTVETSLVTAYNTFGFRLFAHLAEEDNGKNIFISPFSIAVTLAMTYNGTANETQRAMARTLGFEKLDLTAVNTATAGLLTALQNPDPQVQLAIANSLWAGRPWPIQAAFVERCRDQYRAEVRNVDFTAPETAGMINGWVKHQTRDKIDQLIKPADLNPLTMLILLNAIYFKGSWSKQFDPVATREADFHLPDGRRKRVRMMYQTGEYRYYEDGTRQAVSLPYGSGRVSMVLFLPRRESSLSEFQAQLTTVTWRKWLNDFHQTSGNVALPRFKIEYEQQLNESLTALGLGIAFSDKADFGNLSNEPACLSVVRHKAFVEVNEEGTEAAAATAVVIRALSMAPSRPFQLTFDRPFFCAIVDNQTGAILFMGSIVDPQ